jgi:hypothetical protein
VTCHYFHSRKEKLLCNLEQPLFLFRGDTLLMPLLTVIVYLIVVGVLLWLVNTFIPMAGSIKSILNVVVVILVVVWLLNVFGLLTSLEHIRIGRT